MSKGETVRSPLPQRKRIEVSGSKKGKRTEGETSSANVAIVSIEEEEEVERRWRRILRKEPVENPTEARVDESSQVSWKDRGLSWAGPVRRVVEGERGSRTRIWRSLQARARWEPVGDQEAVYTWRRWEETRSIQREQGVGQTGEARLTPPPAILMGSWTSPVLVFRMRT